MYQFAYTEIIDDAPEELRAREYAAMDQTIRMLRIARDKGSASREMVDALFYSRRLWAIFLDDLNKPQNELPEQLRASLISIGIWVQKEIERVRSGSITDVSALIEINEIIRDGLK